MSRFSTLMLISSFFCVSLTSRLGNATAFNEARGHCIERENYLEDLHGRSTCTDPAPLYQNRYDDKLFLFVLFVSFFFNPRWINQTNLMLLLFFLYYLQRCGLSRWRPSLRQLRAWRGTSNLVEWFQPSRWPNSQMATEWATAFRRSSWSAASSASSAFGPQPGREICRPPLSAKYLASGTGLGQSQSRPSEPARQQAIDNCVPRSHKESRASNWLLWPTQGFILPQRAYLPRASRTEAHSLCGAFAASRERGPNG